MNQAGKAVTWATACAATVAAFEGCDLVAKVDTIGTGQPVTWCHGETKGDVRVGQRFTREECGRILAARLPEYWREIRPCINAPTSDNEKIAYTSTAYNIGPAAFCRSSMARKLNAGDHVGACNALMLYTRARGVEVRGLVNRRAAERKICLMPDNHPGAEVARKAAIPPPAPIPPAPKPPRLFSWAWWTQQ